MAKKRVLFVCLGNICRSPAGEAVLRHYLEQRGSAESYQVDSAGTSSYHLGEPPDPRMSRAAERRGYRLQGSARQFSPADFDRFDLIVAMDQSNFRTLKNRARTPAQTERLRLFSDFVPDSSPRDVPDPYYGGPDGFDRVLDLLERGAPAIVESLEKGKD